jgi:hypothetical protein
LSHDEQKENDKPTSETDFWSEVESDGENSFSDYEPTPKKPKLENSIVRDFDAAVGKLRGILCENVSDSYLVKHYQNFVKNANRISTGVQLAAFFESLHLQQKKIQSWCKDTCAANKYQEKGWCIAQ